MRNGSPALEACVTVRMSSLPGTLLRCGMAAASALGMTACVLLVTTFVWNGITDTTLNLTNLTTGAYQLLVYPSSAYSSSMQVSYH